MAPTEQQQSGASQAAFAPAAPVSRDSSVDSTVSLSSAASGVVVPLPLPPSPTAVAAAERQREAAWRATLAQGFDVAHINPPALSGGAAATPAARAAATAQARVAKGNCGLSVSGAGTRADVDGDGDIDVVLSAAAAVAAASAAAAPARAAAAAAEAAAAAAAVSEAESMPVSCVLNSVGTDEGRWPLLHTAAAGGYTDCVIQLIKMRYVDMKTNVELNLKRILFGVVFLRPLYHRSQSQMCTCTHAWTTSCNNCCISLFHLSADPCTRAGGTQLTACHLAAQAGRAGAIVALLAAGAPVDAAAAGDGSTALLAAAQNGHADSVAALLRGGADPDRARADGTFPGDKSESSMDFCRLISIVISLNM